jgi:hypothetical protein
MLLLVLVMPILLLCAMLGMNTVERWLDRDDAAARPVAAEPIAVAVPVAAMISPRRA